MKVELSPIQLAACRDALASHFQDLSRVEQSSTDYVWRGAARLQRDAANEAYAVVVGALNEAQRKANSRASA